jgi:hypothetical protein
MQQKHKQIKNRAKNNQHIQLKRNVFNETIQEEDNQRSQNIFKGD